MATKTEDFVREKKAFIETARKQMNDWRNYVHQLRAEVKRLPVEDQTGYEQSLRNLQISWEQVETKFKEMELATSDEWNTAVAGWQDAATQFQDTFEEIASRINKDEVPLGWLEGFTNHRDQVSQGWAEGFGVRPAGSEGWAEGFEGKPEDSKGWAEGYSKN